MTIKEALAEAGIQYSRAARALGIGKTTFSNMVNHGQYPLRRAEELRQQTEKMLLAEGVSGEIEWPRPGVRPDRLGVGLDRREAVLLAAERRREDKKAAAEREREDKKAAAGAEAERKARGDTADADRSRGVAVVLGCVGTPFLNDVEEDADVYRFRGYERVEREIQDAVKQAAMIAVVSESGAGKTTIWDGVQAELAGRADVRLCSPKVLSRERMRADHLTASLIHGLAGEEATVPHSIEARGRYASRLLMEAKQAGVTPVLYIDDAHFCDRMTMRAAEDVLRAEDGALPDAGDRAGWAAGAATQAVCIPRGRQPDSGRGGAARAGGALPRVQAEARGLVELEALHGATG